MSVRCLNKLCLNGTVTYKVIYRYFNTDLSKEQIKFRKMCREFAERKLKPIAAELDRERKFPKDQITEMHNLGLLGINIPVEYCGLGLEKLSTALAVEEVSRCCGSTGAFISIHNFLYMNSIAKYGTAEQKKLFLQSGLCDPGCFAYSEPDAGSDAANISTTACLDGDDYVLNGIKSWVTSGLQGTATIIFATVDKQLKHKGITAFLIPLPYKGICISKIENKMGIRATSTCNFTLTNVRIPKCNILGKVGDGFIMAMSQFDEARVGIASQAIGIAQAALELAVHHASVRKTFGRPINEFQAVQIRIADMASRLESARLSVWKAAYLCDQPGKSTKETSIAKLLASETATFVTHTAIQILGGLGYTTDTPAERYYRDARVTEIYGGISDIQRLVIAQSIIKEYKK